MQRRKFICILLICLLVIAGGITACLIVWHNSSKNELPEEYRLIRVYPSIRADANGYGRFTAVDDHQLYRIEIRDIAKIQGSVSLPALCTTYYHAQITYDYLNNREMNQPAVVSVRYTPSSMELFEPRMLPGSCFVALGRTGETEFEGAILLELRKPYLFKLWEYEGETYLYPYSNLETDAFGEGVEFWFEEELPIYDPVRDADILAYLAGRGMEPPEFRHKYELWDFVEHVKQYCS